MAESIKKKAVKGLFWTGLERFSQQGLQFVIGIILARLLSPEEFGIVGMVTVFVTVLRVFVDSGFTHALIQSKSNTHLQESSVFYLNVGISVIAALALYLSAPLIADFYNQPELVDITKVLSLLVVLGSFRAVHMSLLSKAVDFKPQFYVNVGSRVLSGGIGIYFAYAGHGVWALVYQKLAQDFFSSIGFWIVSKWRPLFSFSFKSLKGLWQFGSKVLMQGILRTISDNIYTLVIGRVFSAADLGVYTRGKSLVGFPQNLISSTIGKVAFPLYATLQDDKERFRAAVSKGFKLMVFVSIPVFLWLFSVAEPLVYVLLGEKWMMTVPFVKLFAIMGMLYPWHLINVQALLAYGRSDLNLRITFIKNGLRLLVLFVCYRWGLMAIVWGQLGLNVFGLLINAYYTNKVFDYGIIKQLKDVLMLLLLGCVALFAFVLFTNYILIENSLLLCIIGMVIFAGIYLGLAFIFKLEAIKELLKYKR